MICQIIKREILEHITSLRFSLTIGLVLILMIINALIFINGYSNRLSEYSKDVNEALKTLEERSENLSRLGIVGPGSLYKSPSPLGFCAMGKDELLPKKVQGDSYGSRFGIGSNEFHYSWNPIWKLDYPEDKFRKNEFLPNFVELDWFFIIGIIFSLVAILFSFDAISGEREHGTLSLVMSNSISRGSVILGKFVGAFVCTMIPLILGVLINLLIVNSSSSIQLEGNDWTKLVLMIGVSIVYISGFIGLGLFVSSFSASSSTSLLTLLFFWVIFVVLMPGSLGAIAGNFKQSPSRNELSQKTESAREEVKSRFPEEKLYAASPSEKPPKIEALKIWAEYLTEEQKAKSRITNQHLQSQLAQVEFGLKLARLSPAGIYQHTMETLAGTGLVRHKSFLRNVREYSQRFVEFIKSEDRTDSESPHIYGVREGMSQKTVDLDNIPRFEDKYTAKQAFQEAITDITILVAFAGVFFISACLAFLRCDVR